MAGRERFETVPYKDQGGSETMRSNGKVAKERADVIVYGGNPEKAKSVAKENCEFLDLVAEMMKKTSSNL